MPDDREIEQAAFAELRRTGDPKLRDRLVEENLWLARHCSRRFSGRGESADYLGHERLLPATKEGDVLLIANAGAYGHAMSSNYNLREPACGVII